MATKYKPGVRDALRQARELLSSVNSPDATQGSGAAERVLECAFRLLESVYTTIGSGTSVIFTSSDSAVVKLILELVGRWDIHHHAERGAVALPLFHCNYVAPTPKLEPHLGDPHHQSPPVVVLETIPSASSCCRSLLSPLENDALVGVEEVWVVPVLWWHGRAELVGLFLIAAIARSWISLPYWDWDWRTSCMGLCCVLACEFG